MNEVFILLFDAQICVDRSWLWPKPMKRMNLSEWGGFDTCCSTLNSPPCTLTCFLKNYFKNRHLKVLKKIIISSVAVHRASCSLIHVLALVRQLRRLAKNFKTCRFHVRFMCTLHYIKEHVKVHEGAAACVESSSFTQIHSFHWFRS
jgi:hypothetical protein